ncbi:hypothetical protein VTK56DRAFT_8326 [Thermocarpiscus australiensis]
MTESSKPLSLTLRPTKGPTRLFIQAQFCTKPQRVALTPSTSLQGKTALITGATSGLGYHAARHLLSLQLSRLVLTTRSPAKGEAVARELRAAFPGAAVEVWELEMASYVSVVRFARRVEAEFGRSGDDDTKTETTKKKKKRLDIAILNAGLDTNRFLRNPETGHCQTVQVNYLSTFLLAILLMPVLRDTQGRNPGRLTIVGSGGVFLSRLPNRHKRPLLASFDHDDDGSAGGVAGQSPFEMLAGSFEQYLSSKLLGMLLFVRIWEYLPPADELVVNMVDPGLCKGTEIHRDVGGIVSTVMRLAKALSARSVEDGAWTYVDAAVVKGKESHGCFVMDWQIRHFAYVVYEPDAQELMDTLFEETMAELEFAGAQAPARYPDQGPRAISVVNGRQVWQLGGTSYKVRDYDSSMPTIVYNCAYMPAICKNVKNYLGSLPVVGQERVFHFNRDMEAKPKRKDTRRHGVCPGDWVHNGRCPEQDQPAWTGYLCPRCLSTFNN